MQPNTSRELFVNLPVRDLQRSRAFFSELGFTFNEQFSNDKGACMIISDVACVMLLTEPFFRTFTRHAICDTQTHTEALIAFSATSREEVDSLVRRAISLGGRPAVEPLDHGVMYAWSFYDLDGHYWEAVWMDPEAC